MLTLTPIAEHLEKIVVTEQEVPEAFRSPGRN
jgi:hypothetical protein